VTHALWFQQIQIFLLGQAATMLDTHIWLYAGLTLLCLSVLVVTFRSLEILHFDPEYAKATGVKAGGIHALLHILVMLIAPPAAARQWTQKFSSFLVLSAILGMVSGFLGNALSVWLSLPLPTGPTIVLVATTLCLLSLFFAPRRGFVPRLIRIIQFRLRSEQENLLKALYKEWPIAANPYHLWRMRRKKWIAGTKLTKEGHAQAEKLIRLHRLWEVYLVHMGQESDRVHHSAEEMEHILTPEIEIHLLSLLGHPTSDPHEQPIPGGRP
jgi:manganese/zinc/iron transport system permease protein